MRKNFGIIVMILGGMLQLAHFLWFYIPTEMRNQVQENYCFEEHQVVTMLFSLAILLLGYVIVKQRRIYG